MKRKMRQMSAFICTAAMAISLAACGSTGSEGGKPEETGKQADNTDIVKDDTADVIFTNGLVYTEDEAQPWAEAFAVKDNKFIYVGEADTDKLKALTGENTKIIDLEGKMVTPSLIDAHTHPATVSMTAWCAEIWEDSIEDYERVIAEYCAEHSKEDEPYIYFKCYPSDLFGTEGPKKEIIDAIEPDRPIMISDFSDHAAWVNTKWLETYGAYDMDPDDPRLDCFVRTPDGDFQGWITELGFTEHMDDFYERLGWRPPIDCTVEVMSLLTNDLKSWGVTGVFDGYLEQEMQIESIHKMDEEGTLNMYYDMSVMLSDYSELDETLDYINELNDKYGSDYVTMDTLKIFYDGTNELGTSALVDGTLQKPDYHGELFMNAEETKDTIKKANEKGVDVHFHLVGDLAFRMICDAVEELQKEDGPLDIQVEMCHCEYINPADRKRPAELGIIINWTPHWTGGYFGEAARTYLGDERFDDMYQFNPTIDAGGIVTFGSDVYSWDEEYRANPYFGMQTAMTRIDIDTPLESNGGVRKPEEGKLSLENLLKGYTINAAKQLRIDDRTGSIETGKRANFNIYTENLFEVDPFEFMDVMPESVVFEGNVISGKEIG